MKTPIEYLAEHTGKNEKTHRELDEFFDAVGYPQYRTDRTAWCAAAAGWACIQAGYEDIIMAIPKGDRLMARAWDVHEDKLAALGVVRIGGAEAITQGDARPGDIVTYVRNNTSKKRSVLASGHIDFFTEYDHNARRVYGLGGNESNKVQNGGSTINNVLSVYRLPELSEGDSTAGPDKFPNIMPYVFADEGGYSNYPDDPPTNKGITIDTYRRYIKNNGTIADLKALTIEQATVVYRAQYWNKVRGDDLPHGVDYCVFDMSVHSGPSRAAKFLQKVVGTEQDGEIGPITLAATAKMDPADIVNEMMDDRLAWLQTLPKWRNYGRGWTNRVNKVKARALQLVKDAPATPNTSTPTTPSLEGYIAMFSVLFKALPFALPLVQAMFPGSKKEAETEKVNPITSLFRTITGALGVDMVADDGGLYGLIGEFLPFLRGLTENGEGIGDMLSGGSNGTLTVIAFVIQMIIGNMVRDLEDSNNKKTDA